MTFLFPLVAALAASFISTLTGFGFALIALPAFAVVMDAKSSVALSMLLFSVLGPFFAWSARHEVDVPLLKRLLLSSLPGLPIGTLFISTVGDGALRLVIGATIVVAALLLAFDRRPTIAAPRRAAIVIGFITGVLTTSVGASGPLVVVFLASQRTSNESLRATGGAFMVGMIPVSFVLFAISGLVTAAGVLTAIQLAPAIIVGYLAGLRVLPMVNPVVFRRIVVALVLASGATMLVSAAGKLLVL
ncbi:MAG TPA: sulfite exporter TauE/SafE family protein [Chloroflexota bacterium]